MASITYGDKTTEIAPYKLRELRAAAPYIDRALAKRRAVRSRLGDGDPDAADRPMEFMTDSVNDVLSVIAVGILKDRREFPYTPEKIAAVADEIEGEMDIDGLSVLNSLFDSILREAGMVRGERPLAAGAPTGDSSSQSSESSQSSSQPDALEETGTE